MENSIQYLLDRKQSGMRMPVLLVLSTLFCSLFFMSILFGILGFFTYGYEWKWLAKWISILSAILLVTKLTSSTCQLTLDKEGFSLQNLNKFNLFKQANIKHTWSDFAYQSSWVAKHSIHVFEIHLLNGKYYTFLFGNKSESLKEMEMLSADIKRLAGK